MAHRTPFKPINENALEHLVSHPLSQKILGLRYIGSVIDENNKWLPSPDCFMADEHDNNKLLKVEFKKAPLTHEIFEENCEFDVAIIWTLAYLTDSETTFKAGLRRNNKCERIIVLTDYEWFRSLPEYNMTEINRTLNLISKKYISRKDELISKVRDLRRPESIFTAYVASAVYPDGINTKRLIAEIREAYKLPKTSERKSDGNIYNALKWVKPISMLIKKNKGNFVWNDYYNVENTSEVVREILKDVSGESMIPNQATLDGIRIAIPR